MRERLTSLAAILFATTAIASVANAQASYPCVSDAPNPYHQVPWAASPRALGPVNSVFVDVRDDVWVADRCGTPFFRHREKEFGHPRGQVTGLSG